MSFSVNRSNQSGSSSANIPTPISYAREKVNAMVGEDPNLQGLQPEEKELLANILTQFIQHKQITDASNPDKARIYKQIQSDKAQFVETCTVFEIFPELNDETEEPVIFSKIAKAAHVYANTLGNANSNQPSAQTTRTQTHQLSAPLDRTNFSSSSSSSAGSAAAPAAGQASLLGINFAERVNEIIGRDQSLQLMPQGGKQLLAQMLSNTVEMRLIADPRDPKRRQFMGAVAANKQEFREYCQRSNIAPQLDDANEPVLYEHINDTATELAKVHVMKQKKELIQASRPGINLEGKSAAEIEQLHSTCFNERVMATRVMEKISSLIKNAQLPSEQERTFNVVSLEHARSEEPRFDLKIQNNMMMGYSVWELLCVAGVRSRNDLFQVDNPNLQSYRLTNEELAKVDEALTEVLKWNEDFTQIMADLLGDEPEKYITTGQKKMGEVIDNPLHMSPNAIAQLRRLPRDSTCMLLNQVSLNLTQHPKRDFIKRKIEEFYALENMVAANGMPKRFLDLDPYRTVINYHQLRQICPRLNRLLKFQQAVKNFLGTPSLEDGINMLRSGEFGIENELDVLKMYNRDILNEMYRSILGRNTPGNQLDQLDFQLSARMINGPAAIDSLEQRSKELCEELLTTRTGVFFKAPEQPFEPTPQQISALYDGNMMITYQGNQRHKNMAQLFARLKRAPEIVTILREHPEYAGQLNELQAVLIDRLNKYHGLDRSNSHYSQQTVDRAVGYIEQYVAKIVYRNQSNVSPQSIEASLMALFANDWADVRGRCATGLDGRIQNLVLQLSATVGSDLQSNIDQYKKECMEGAFTAFVSGQGYYGETSMLPQYRTKAEQFLGLQPNNQRLEYNRLEGNVKAIVDIFLHGRTTPNGTFQPLFTPVMVYHKARQFFCDTFWRLNKERNEGEAEEIDNKIYDLFTSLGFPGTHKELDAKYRVNGDPEKGWQYAFFQQDLPKYLVPFLAREKYLIVKENNQVGTVFAMAGQNPVIVAAPQQQNRMQQQQRAQQQSQGSERRRNDDDDYRVFGQTTGANKNVVDNTAG